MVTYILYTVHLLLTNYKISTTNDVKKKQIHTHR